MCFFRMGTFTLLRPYVSLEGHYESLPEQSLNQDVDAFGRPCAGDCVPNRPRCCPRHNPCRRTGGCPERNERNLRLPRQDPKRI